MKRKIVGGMMAALAMAALTGGTMAFARSAELEAQSVDAATVTAEVSEAEDEKAWSLEDYEAELDSYVKKGLITEDEKTKLISSADLEAEYEQIWNDAISTGSYSEDIQKIEKEWQEVEKSVEKIERKLPDTFWDDERSDDSDKEAALTEVEQNTLKQVEKEMKALEKKWDALYDENETLKDGAKEKETQYEKEYAVLEASVEDLYEKIYDYQMDELVKKGIITDAEKSELMSAYEKWYTLDEQYNTLIEKAIKESGVSDKLEALEEKLETAENETASIEEKLEKEWERN